MYNKLFKDTNFFLLLLKIDNEIVNLESEKKCQFCSGVLHRSDYPRKPRGEPEGLLGQFYIRFSLCCSNDGCRRRSTPGSVRFFGRRRWIGSVFLVASILQGDCNRNHFKMFCHQIGISIKVAKRWRRWWNEDFPRTYYHWQKKKHLIFHLSNKESYPDIIFAYYLRKQRKEIPSTIILSLMLLNYQDIYGDEIFRRIGPFTDYFNFSNKKTP